MKKLILILPILLSSCSRYIYVLDIQSKGHGHTQAEGFKIKAGVIYKEVFNQDTIKIAVYKIQER